MATYKVIQDVEAEDKLVGPLTLRQFIYAIIAAGSLYLVYLVASKGAVFLAPVFLIPALVSGFFAFPWGRDQSTEVWALARIRFLFFPRKRIWNQSGVKDLVTVTAPKRPEQVYTDGLSQTEVRSRLRALATTIDSRGWALKDSVLLAAATVAAEQSSDRLVAPSSAPREVPSVGTEVYTDVLDAHVGVGQKFDAMLTQNASAARDRATQALQSEPAVAVEPAVAAAQQADYWFMNQTGPAPTDATAAVFGGAVVHPGQAQAIADDPQAQALESLINEPNHAQQFLQSETPHFSSIHTVQPLRADTSVVSTGQVDTPVPTVEPAPTIIQAPATVASQVVGQDQASQAPGPIAPAKVDDTAEPMVTEKASADILNLSQNNDLSIATISHEANKRDDETEVTISLH